MSLALPLTRFPLIYPILDASFIPAISRAGFLDRVGRSLADSGLRVLEYRNKTGTDVEVFRDAEMLRAVLPAGPGGVQLVMDDRVDVALAASFDGVHVDQGDLPADVARDLMGVGRVVGTSASTEAELRTALSEPVDYVAFGPVFVTTTKQTSARLIGLEGVRRFRSVMDAASFDMPNLKAMALVAAAGITLETAAAVLEAGADSVAVSAAIFGKADPAKEFWRWMAELSHHSVTLERKHKTFL